MRTEIHIRYVRITCAACHMMVYYRVSIHTSHTFIYCLVTNKRPAGPAYVTKYIRLIGGVLNTNKRPIGPDKSQLNNGLVIYTLLGFCEN